MFGLEQSKAEEYEKLAHGSEPQQSYLRSPEHGNSVKHIMFCTKSGAKLVKPTAVNYSAIRASWD